MDPNFKGQIDRFGSVVLSLIRSYFTCGLIFFVLLLTNHGYVSSKARQSISRDLFCYIAVDFYRASYSILIEKFFPNEKFNEEAVKLVKKKKKR